MVKRITIETFETGTEGANLTYIASNSRFEWVKGDARPSFTISAPTPVNESGTITYTLTTNYVDDGTKIPFTLTLSNTDNQANDFVSTSGDVSNATLTGNFVVSSGSNAVSLSLNEDFTTEGTETLTITLDDYPTISNVVSITDSSTAGGGAVGLITSTTMYFFAGYDGNAGSYGSSPNSPGQGYGSRISSTPLASDTSHTLETTTPSPVSYQQGLSDKSGGVGYAIAGLDAGSPSYPGKIQSFTYASSTVAIPETNLEPLIRAYGGVGFNGNDGDGGLVGGGVNPQGFPTTRGRAFYWIPYASVTTQTFGSNHPLAQGVVVYQNGGAVSPDNSGYILDGNSPSVPGNFSSYYKVDLSSYSWSTVNSIPSSYRGQQGTSTQSSEAAYLWGGVHTDYSTPQPYPWGYKTEKMPFASDTTRTVTTLPTSYFHRLGAGIASDSAGYIAGGLTTPANPGNNTGLYKFPFASETSISSPVTNGYIGYEASTHQD